MIYERPRSGDPIRQGDIFVGVPRVDISLHRIAVATERGPVEKSWSEIQNGEKNVEALLPVSSVTAIVISQDCDALRAPDISLCEIRPFVDVHREAKQTVKPESWMSVITSHPRRHPKWFYLPPDGKIFTQRMGVDFFSTFRLVRVELQSILSFREIRLIDIARTHFRERIGEFFRRFPYDEWYPLSQEEFLIYRERVASDAQPFDWQK